MAKRPLSAVPGRKWPVSDFSRKAAALSGGFRFKVTLVLYCIVVSLYK